MHLLPNAVIPLVRSVYSSKKLTLVWKQNADNSYTENRWVQKNIFNARNNYTISTCLVDKGLNACVSLYFNKICFSNSIWWGSFTNGCRPISLYRRAHWNLILSSFSTARNQQRTSNNLAALQQCCQIVASVFRLSDVATIVQATWACPPWTAISSALPWVLWINALLHVKLDKINKTISVCYFCAASGTSNSRPHTNKNGL